MRPHRPAANVLGALILVALTAIGCGGEASPVPTLGVASPTPIVSPPPITAGPADPPVATIAVEGGDPVIGQLGTYSWAGGGSSSPWLPGSTIAVGGQEILTVRLEPSVVVTEWTARIAPAGGDDTDAVVIASGNGQPVIGAPEEGAWTLAVTVRFGSLGSATYAWRLDVS